MNFLETSKNLLILLCGKIFDKFECKKEFLQLHLSLAAFETQYHVMNDLFMSKNLFLRVYEPRKSFTILLKTFKREKMLPQKNFWPVLKSVSAVFSLWKDCVKINVDIFIDQLALSSNLFQKSIKLLNVTFRNPREMLTALRESKKEKRVALSIDDQCYACNKFFIEPKSLERHLNSCAHMPGLVYKFENQSIQTFFDNVKFMGDLLFAIYFDFESTCGKKNTILMMRQAYTLFHTPFWSHLIQA